MNKALKNILPNTIEFKIHGDEETQISSLALDSRKVKPGTLFFAIKGAAQDGHKYIQSAIEKGAVAVVCENLPKERDTITTYVQTPSCQDILGSVCSLFFNNPSSKLKLVGVTGTNGKTTIVTLLYKLFSQLGFKAGLLSTIQNCINDKIYPTSLTTPDNITINEMLYEMAQQGCEYCFMEVSSHAVMQQRIGGLQYAGGIFTNITHDHLDYHKTFKNYIKAKQEFFNLLPKTSFALFNADDKNGKIMVQNTQAKKYDYGLKSLVDFKGQIIENHPNGTLIFLDSKEVWVNFIGNFNIQNLLAVYGCATLMGQDKEACLQIISQLKSAPGRFDTVHAKNDITAIIDYAHTPDAIKNVLNAAQDLAKNRGKIITIVGAGGDRDKTKRPEMALVAAELSDKVIITSDNPRTENPESIIEDMKAGLQGKNLLNSICITNREEAIKTACMMATPGDFIMILGKGHEDYQEVNHVKHHFDDKEKAMYYLNLKTQ